jgi:hypothetical protein
MLGVGHGQRRGEQRPKRGWRRARTASAGAITDAHVAGKVTAQSGGAAIAGVAVCVYSTAGSSEGCASTEAKGEYNIEVPEGSYDVAFYSENCLVGECEYLDYLTQYYNGKTREDEAETLVLKAGETRSGINAAMAAGAEIEGQVTAAVGGSELEDVEVCAFSYEAEFVYRCSYTEEEGFYTIVGLPTARYYVSFSADHLNLVSQYYKEARSYEEATLVQAIVGTQKHGIDAQLHQGAEIEGVVTAAAGGAAVSDSEVCPVEPTGAAEAECTYTNSEGKYTLEGLEGEYSVRFYGNGSTLGPELYENATGPSTEKIIKAVPPAVTKGVNASLPTAGQITGVVTAAPSGSPVDGVEVCARSEAGFSECAKTSASGEYTIKGVAGLYTVEFYGNESCTPSCSPLPYKSQYYNGIYSSESAEAITVAPGTTVSAINARLAESVKQGEEETLARKVAEAVAKATEAAAKLHAEEAAAAKKHEEEAVATAAAAKKHEEEVAAAKKRGEEAAASVKIEKVKVTAKDLVVTIKASEKGVVTITGPGLKKTVEALTAGTHVVKIALTKIGKADRAHGKKIKLAVSLKVDSRTVSGSKEIKL